MENMEVELQNVIVNFDLEKALKLTDKMHEIDAMRELTLTEERLWEQLTVKIEQKRNNKFFL